MNWFWSVLLAAAVLWYYQLVQDAIKQRKHKAWMRKVSQEAFEAIKRAHWTDEEIAEYKARLEE